LRDSFKNNYLLKTNHTLSIAIGNWVQGKDYSANVTNLGNATYAIDFVSNKSGLLVGLSLTINDVDSN